MEVRINESGFYLANALIKNVTGFGEMELNYGFQQRKIEKE